MPFTNPWNEASPDDNRVASLYGDDLRDMRTDFSQRAANFGAGLKAARLDPEAVFGDANKGAAFYATDENVLYRWNGSAWVVGATNRVFTNLNSITFTNPAVDTDGLTITIPASYLRVGSILDIRLRATRSSGGIGCQLRFGATTLEGISPISGSIILSLRALVAVITATTQRAVAMAITANDFLDITVPNPAEDITTAIVVKTVAPAGTGVFTHDMLTVKVLG